MGYPFFCIHLDTKTRIDLYHSFPNHTLISMIWKLGSAFNKIVTYLRNNFYHISGPIFGLEIKG